MGRTACNVVTMERVTFGDIPWPVFESVQGFENITGEPSCAIRRTS